MNASKSGSFLMELILSILFFSVASAVCIQLFAKAHLLDQKTGYQNQAVIWAENLASLWQAENGDLSIVRDTLCADYAAAPGSVVLSDSDSLLLVYLDKDGMPTPDAEQSAAYVQLSNKTEEAQSHMLAAGLCFYAGQEPFYEITLIQHLPLERGNLDR